MRVAYPSLMKLALYVLALLGAANAGCKGGDDDGSAFSHDAADASTESGFPCWQAVGACPNPSEAGAPCSTDSECPSDLYCAFEIHGGCAAPGSCQHRIPGNVLCVTPAEPYVCDCAGNTLQMSGCSGPYAPVPIDHVGACEGSNDAAVDAQPD